MTTTQHPPRLHLGCGQRYLDGYVNIDFPLNNHPVQQESVADLHADICGLSYPVRSVAEVRLHHVFEHFRRPVACALLATWHDWLVDGGRLHIEVPDLARTLLVIYNPLASFRRKAVAERHLYGSHEASWAAHYEGYTPRSLARMVQAFDFRVAEIRRAGWRGTHNFEILATKHNATLSPEDCRGRAEAHLRQFLVDDSSSERVLLQTWMKAYDEQVARGRSGRRP